MESPSFQIHPQLTQDCRSLGRFKVSHVLLHRNATLPWFILVPETDQNDLLDLEPDLRNRIMDEASAVSDFIKTQLHYTKINVAAIGNVVPQLHIHVVGRKPGDALWPNPIWGHLKTERSYSTETLEKWTSQTREYLKLQ